MKKVDLIYVCTMLANLSGLPVRLYKNGERIFYRSTVELVKDAILPFEREILSVSDSVGYYITPYFDYYGVINSGCFKIAVGPSRPVPLTEREVKEIAFLCDVDKEDLIDFSAALKSMAIMPLESVMQSLCAVNYAISGEKVNVEEVVIYDAEQRAFLKKLAEDKTESVVSEDYVGEDEPHRRNSLAIEQTIMNIVRKGDTAALNAWLKSAPAVNGGILAGDALRQAKNTFIVACTLTSRAAIRGGVDVTEALALSDRYIRECELLVGGEGVANLQYAMLLDYTERVERLRSSAAGSKLAMEVANYIRRNLSEPIRTEKIAKSMYMSRSRLSTKFKQETGKNLVDFVLGEKVEEAKRLLRYTDKSLGAISAYLGFSSQSHFSRAFKKYAERTPNEYRNFYSE